jgi:hypothetical protein
MIAFGLFAMILSLFIAASEGWLPFYWPRWFKIVCSIFFFGGSVSVISGILIWLWKVAP